MMNKAAKIRKIKELETLLAAKKGLAKYEGLNKIFPDTGPLRRSLYKKQVAFFTSGATCSQRAMIAANRTGKSFAGGYEMVLHLTGQYPGWWEGRRFNHPITAWAVGVTNEATKDVLQNILLGDFADLGSGMLPKSSILHTVNRPGVPEAVQTLRVPHFTNGVEDGVSVLGFKSYDQKRPAFQGTTKDVIWLDEEPRDVGIYSECVTRTMTCDGMIYCTFTPLFGLSDVVTSFMPGGRIPDGGYSKDGYRYVTQIDWSEVPHLTEKSKNELLSTYSPYERDARAKGIPQLGSGAIYPILEEEILVKPFEIPSHWPRVYGMDVGWNKTAAIWGAMDPNTHQVYLYSEHYQGKAEPPIHAAAVKARGEWIPGVIDPKSNGANQADGSRLMELYVDLGLDLIPADNAVEAGLLRTWQMLSSGQLKVFDTLHNWLSEFRIYRRDTNGKVVKNNDHLMDCMRYLTMSGIEVMDVEQDQYSKEQYMGSSDSGGNQTTGY